MQPNNNLNILPWYDSANRQHHRKSYAYDDIYPLISPDGKFPPFQIVRYGLAVGDAITEFKLFRLETGTELDVLADMAAAGLTIKGTDWIFNYPGITSPQYVTGTYTAWGWSIGKLTDIRYLKTTIYPFDAGNIPLTFKVVLKTGKTGTTLATKTITSPGITVGVPRQLLFDFGSEIPNTGLNHLWLEITADGYWSAMGNDLVYAVPPDEGVNFFLAGGINDAPNTNDTPDDTGSGQVEVIAEAKAYDIICYYPSAAIATATPEGRYYARMSDGTNTWFSEIFTICGYLGDLLKLSYWHHADFVHSGALINYDTPYKNVLYLPTEIGKPEYPFEEKVRKIDGRNLPLHQVSWKRYRFEFFAPEYLLDALRVVRMHSFVTIAIGDEVYDVDEIIISPEWLEQGNIAAVEVEFTTDTVIVNNSGKLTTSEFNEAMGFCIVEDYLCVAIIDEGSLEYDGFYYASTGGGVVDFVTGDYLLVHDIVLDTLRVFQYNGSGYTVPTPSEGETAYVINDDSYYFVQTFVFVKPSVTSTVGSLAVGITFDDHPVNLYGRTDLGIEYFIGSGTAVLFESTGIPFSLPTPDIHEIQARVSSASCDNFAESDWSQLTGLGIGWMEIESTNIVG